MSKIDRLVAERVMQWPHITFVSDTPSDGYIRLGKAYRGSDHQTDPCCLWQPSTNVAVAWEVVESMDARKFGVNITRVKSISGGDLSWATDLNHPHENGAYGNGDDANICVSICLAALRAVGVPESEIQEAMR